MSTATHSVVVKALDDQLNKQILSGDALGAFESFYADDVVMQENSDDPRVGKDVNRKLEQDFFSSIEQFHGAQVLGSAVNGGVSYSEWEYDFTPKGGKRMKLTQVAARRWKMEKSLTSVSTTTRLKADCSSSALEGSSLQPAR